MALTRMLASTSCSSSSGMCTNCSARSSAAAKAMRSSAVSRVCRRLLTNTSTGLSGECAYRGSSSHATMIVLSRDHSLGKHLLSMRSY